MGGAKEAGGGPGSVPGVRRRYRGRGDKFGKVFSSWPDRP